jgi:large subunit ribosomal protein L4
MSTVTLKTRDGKDAGSLELDAEVFGVQPNVPVMHQVVTAQLAARRAGTQSTKTRAEVSGGGKKPFKQKGTGNARQGSTRSPHFSGGGVALGPKPRKYGQKTPKKMVKLALRSALSDRAAEGKVVVIDEWAFEAPKTKSALAALAALGIDGKALVVVNPNDTNTIRSFLNLPEVQLIEVNELNAYDVLCSDWVVFSKSTLPGEVAEATAVKEKAPAKKASVSKDTVSKDTVSKDTAKPAAADLPAGAKAPKADGGAPKGYEIKGNVDSGLYHVPGSAFYDRTVAELYFATAEAAEAAGFQLPPSQRDADSAEETN